MQIRKHFRFEAAHLLPHHPGKCSRLHGHSYRLEVAIEGPLQQHGPAAGMVLDFDDLEAAVGKLIESTLDHRSLNEIIENPTAELLARWIWERLEPAVAGLAEIVLWETPTACAVVRADDRAR
jgi:6-pyruvoyltetrahydropterin/6-carboxytetrahydropterin synthase